MTKTIMLAGLLGGVAMFVWSAVGHMVLPLGEAGISQFANEQPIIDAMKSATGDTPGMYLFPGMPKGMSQGDYAKKLSVMPSGILVYSRAGVNEMAPRQFVAEFLVEVVEATLLAFLIAHAGAAGLGFVLVAALFGSVWTNVSYWNWYSFPVIYTVAYWFNQFVGLVLAGLIARRVTRR